MLNKIFSVRNSDDKRHKIINLFGMKLGIPLYKKMKLGIAYNLFDGEELLQDSLKSVRNCADYICVIYQNKSYYGKSANPEIKILLEKYKNAGLIDEIYLYERNFDLNRNDKKFFEKEKRSIGLQLCKKAGMTHYLNMDVDEFYDDKQINAIKRFIEENHINATACSIYEYLKTPEYRFIDSYTYTTDNPYNFYVPFIMKIHKFKKQKYGKDFQTYVDSTRALNGDEKFYLFPVQDVVMHHMCTIRKDLDKKYKNSTYIDGGKEIIDKITNIKEKVRSWQPEENRIGESDYYLFDGKVIEKVENKFNIKIED